MKIDYHDLADSQFEELVIAVCSCILGPGVAPFSSGKDGGRDGRFVGTAAAIPSAAAPHSGKFVIQAKHTENPVAKYSDPDFSGDAESSTLSKEMPRVARLRAAGEMDVYCVFSNRRLAGGADEAVRGRITSETGVDIVELFGIERLDMLLKKFPEALQIADISPFRRPLIVTPDDLAEVILRMAANKDVFAAATVDELVRVSFEEKNRKNGLSAEFAHYITQRYLPEFASVKRFLALPANGEIAERYEEAAREFQEQLLAHRATYADFDQVLVRLQTLLFARDGDLNRNKRLTKLVIYYMYFNCDIGTS